MSSHSEDKQYGPLATGPTSFLHLLARASSLAQILAGVMGKLKVLCGPERQGLSQAQVLLLKGAERVFEVDHSYISLRPRARSTYRMRSGQGKRPTFVRTTPRVKYVFSE